MYGGAGRVTLLKLQLSGSHRKQGAETLLNQYTSSLLILSVVCQPALPPSRSSILSLAVAACLASAVIRMGFLAVYHWMTANIFFSP